MDGTSMTDENFMLKHIFFRVTTRKPEADASGSGASATAGYNRGRAPRHGSPRGTTRKPGAKRRAFLWSLQGMILRPTDYESVALTN